MIKRTFRRKLKKRKVPTRKDEIMGEHLFKHWPIYVLMAGFIWFIVAIYRNAWREERKRQEKGGSQEGKDREGKK